MASSQEAICNGRLRHILFRTTQLLCFSGFFSELINQKGVVAWTYNYSLKAYSWNSSRAFCQRHFTDLVAIQNQNEIAYLNDVIPQYSSYYWIGIRKIDNKWTWVGTNKTLTREAENWAENEPNNKKNNQDCVEIYIKSPQAPGKWNDEPCWKRKRALCYTASCQDLSCSQQGECIETIGNYTCSCYPGFFGPECEYVNECGEFELPQHVLMNCSHPLGNFSFNSQCRFHCAQGYKLNGPNKLECLASGIWTDKPPECVATECPTLKAPENGKMTCLQVARTSQNQSSCNFSCEEGFKLVGPKVVQCITSGVWTASAPVCKAVTCEPLGIPDHGRMDCSLTPSQYNSSCSFQCAEGFLLQGADRVQCTGTGQWTAPAPVCQALKCQELPAVNKAQVNCSSPLGHLRYQTACSFTCDDGFLLAGASVLRCLANGIWDAPPPECQAITCVPLQSPQNGAVTCVQPLGDSSYKSRCLFTCDEGFSLSGLEKLDCTPSGHWSGSPPVCEAIRCPQLLAPEKGSLNCSGPLGEFSVGSTCYFSCNKGTELEGFNYVECTASGEWTTSPPTCKAVVSTVTPNVQCPALLIPEQGTMSCRHHLGLFGWNTTCYFGCKTGFRVLGDRTLRCRQSGQWTAAAPMCRAVKCSGLRITEPVMINCSNPWGNFSYDSTCYFNCPEGQLLQGSSRAVCQENGQWSAPTPICQAGPLTIQEALTYLGGAVASATGLAVGGTLLALLRKRFRQKDDGKSPLNPQSHLGTYGVFTNAAFDSSS